MLIRSLAGVTLTLTMTYVIAISTSKWIKVTHQVTGAIHYIEEKREANLKLAEKKRSGR